MARELPHIGDEVRLLRGRSKKTARVVHYIEGVSGGVRLDDRLDGFCCWNKEDLVILPRKKRAPLERTAKP